MFVFSEKPGNVLKYVFEIWGVFGKNVPKATLFHIVSRGNLCMIQHLGQSSLGSLSGFITVTGRNYSHGVET